MKLLVNRIAAYRHKLGLTQQQLADLVGVSKNAISAFECADYNPSAFVAAKLCEAFNVKFEDLFELI